MANASSWLGCLVVGSEAGRRAMDGSSGTRVWKGQGLGPFPIGLAVGRSLLGSRRPRPQTPAEPLPEILSDASGQPRPRRCAGSLTHTILVTTTLRRGADGRS